MMHKHIFLQSRLSRFSTAQLSSVNSQPSWSPEAGCQVWSTLKFTVLDFSFLKLKFKTPVFLNVFLDDISRGEFSVI